MCWLAGITVVHPTSPIYAYFFLFIETVTHYATLADIRPIKIILPQPLCAGTTNVHTMHINILEQQVFTDSLVQCYTFQS